MSATGSVTVTPTTIAAQAAASVVAKTVIAWTSDAAAGSVTLDSVTLPSGTVVLVEFAPSGGGTAPTDAYDVDLLDPNGVSVFSDGTGASIGANLSSTVLTRKVPFVAGAAAGATYTRTWLYAGTYQLTVANAGNSKQGTVTVYQVTGVA